MKNLLYNWLGVLLIAAIAVAFSLGCAELEKGAKCEEMDAREKNYDPDGDFIMMDTEEGLMGVYHAYKPLTHIWSDEVKKVNPGVYKMDICDGWVELYSNNMRGSIVINLKEKQTDYLRENILQGSPVLVY